MRSYQPQKNPGLAAVLSFLLIGLGQIYNGQIAKGMTMLVGAPLLMLGLANVMVAAAVRHGATGDSMEGLALGVVVLFGLIWLMGVCDAYASAEKVNRSAGIRGSRFASARGASNRRRRRSGRAVSVR